MSLDFQSPMIDAGPLTGPQPEICSIEAHPRAPGLVLRGELDLSNVDEVTEALDRVSEVGASTLLDMSGVSFLDSSGLRALVQHRTKGYDVTIENPSPQVARLLEVSATAEIFTILRTDPDGDAST